VEEADGVSEVGAGRSSSAEDTESVAVSGWVGELEHGGLHDLGSTYPASMRYRRAPWSQVEVGLSLRVVISVNPVPYRLGASSEPACDERSLDPAVNVSCPDDGDLSGSGDFADGRDLATREVSESGGGSPLD